jgi:hypothetical protein
VGGKFRLPGADIIPQKRGNVNSFFEIFFEKSSKNVLKPPVVIIYLCL